MKIKTKFKFGDYIYSVSKFGGQILCGEGKITSITVLDSGEIHYHLKTDNFECGACEDTCYKTMDEVHEVCQKLLKEIDDEQNNRKS